MTQNRQVAQRKDELPRLREVRLLRDRVEDDGEYPFTVPALAGFDRLEFDRRVTFFVGENGSGKSTLLEAIALAAGFGPEGGTRNHRGAGTEHASDAKPLADALRLSWTKKLLRGFFLRAESFYDVATRIDALGVADAYGGTSLHARSHGEAFFALATHRLGAGGLYLLDEPEAALSPQRQLSLLVLIHDLMRSDADAQLIVATHSPILLAFPDARILAFEPDGIRPIAWADSEAVQVTRAFVANPERWLASLFRDRPDADE